MNMITYIKNSSLNILGFFCLLFTINIILLNSKPIGAQLLDIAYMDFLLVFIAIVFLFIGYIKWKNSYKGLCEAVINEDRIDSSLPESCYYFEAQLMKDIIQAKNNEMQLKVLEATTVLEEMNDYITKWVHDIKIPISVCELIADKIDDIQVSEELILEVDRIKFLINQVLYTSRASSYSESLQVSEINLERLIKEALKRNSAFFISKKINLELEYINYNVMSDEKWLSYIIEQLINNACKYTPIDGKISIYAKEDNTAIKLYVRDNGTGIKAKDIKRIFDRGFIGENGRNLAKSTGMGLYLSKKMAQKLNHDIYVETEEGKGTEFTVCIFKLSDYFKVT